VLFTLVDSALVVYRKYVGALCSRRAVIPLLPGRLRLVPSARQA
jgi:hypothetical protein